MAWKTSLGQRMVARGWTIKDVAREVGYDRAYISKVLSGHRPPTMRLMRALERLWPEAHPRELVWWEEPHADGD